MAYIDGFVIAVPTANKQKFIDHAAMADPVFMEWGIEIAYILEVLPLAAHTAVKLLQVVVHHLEPGELAQLQELATLIGIHCRAMQEAL